MFREKVQEEIQNEYKRCLKNGGVNNIYLWDFTPKKIQRPIYYRKNWNHSARICAQLPNNCKYV